MEINIRFAGTEYSIKNKTLEVYTQGCSVKCPGCHNSELWNFDGGEPFPSEKLADKIKRFDKIIDRIFIVGGEPLQQPLSEVVKMIKFFKDLGKEVWLFTSFEIDQVSDDIKELCDYVKTGKFDPNTGDGSDYYGVKLATSNQKIYKKGVDYGKKD